MRNAAYKANFSAGESEIDTGKLRDSTGKVAGQLSEKRSSFVLYLAKYHRTKAE
jgi:hypothetical protein